MSLEITDTTSCNVSLVSSCDAPLRIEDVIQASYNASRGHSSKKEVKDMLKNLDQFSKELFNDIVVDSYKEKLVYRELTRINHDGKVRHIFSPNLYTRVLQHLFIVLIEKSYLAHDNGNGVNCKSGFGINAKDKKKSLLHRLKRVYYDRRDLTYAVVIDQRKCYEHVKEKYVRRALKSITNNKWLIDFGITVSFFNKKLPIGTPTSPLVHHILCLSFDIWCKRACPFSVRYADNCFLATYTKEEAQQLLWRVKNFWWYTIGIRAKRKESRVIPLSLPLDFCGYIFHRIENKNKTNHNKGFTTVRKGILKRAIKCKTNEGCASYFGILSPVDSFNNIVKNMKLTDLVERCKITRNMDAENIKPAELLGKTFTIHDYEIKRTQNGEPNWIKFLISIDECGKAYEFHGEFRALIDFIVTCENTFGGKKTILPIENAMLEQSCGYIFVGSTNRIINIEDYYGGKQ